MVPTLNVAGCGELASLEFAVCALRTPHMIVCDHSKCDAIKACLSPETVQGFDPLPGWIGNGMKGLNDHTARGRIEVRMRRRGCDDDEADYEQHGVTRVRGSPTPLQDRFSVCHRANSIPKHAGLKQIPGLLRLRTDHLHPGTGIFLPIRFAPLVTSTATTLTQFCGFRGGSQNAVSAHARRVSRSVPG